MDEVTEIFKEISKQTSNQTEAIEIYRKYKFKEMILKNLDKLDQPKKEGIIDIIIDDMTTIIITKKAVWKLYYNDRFNIAPSINRTNDIPVIKNLAIVRVDKVGDKFRIGIHGTPERVLTTIKNLNLKAEIKEITYKITFDISSEDDILLPEITGVNNENNQDIAEHLKGLKYVYAHPKIWTNNYTFKINSSRKTAKIIKGGPNKSIHIKRIPELIKGDVV